MKNDGLTVQDFRDLTQDQLVALRSLKVSVDQEVLGKSFVESIDDWEAGSSGSVLGVCFLHENQPVGLVLFNRGYVDAPHTVSIHGLKIATPWQGRGWGHLGFGLAVEYLRQVWPDIDGLKLSVDAVNTPAIAIYRAWGMSDSGPVPGGPNGAEHRMTARIGLAPTHD